MRLLIALALAFTAACSRPATAPAESASPTMPEAQLASSPALDLGPYSNSWDAAEFSRFRHTIQTATPGTHRISLQATTNSPGGETVAVYPIGPDGARQTARIFFVVADGDGSSAERDVEITAEGLAVEVVVENAGGRRHAGSYTLTVTPPR